MHRWIIIAALLLPPWTILAATVDPPLRARITKLDRSEVSGLITSYTPEGLEVMDAKKQTVKIGWDELPPDLVIGLHERLMRKPSADDWFSLGKKLLTMPGGKAPAERAFGRAVRLDATMKDKIAAAKKDAALQPPPVRTPAPGESTEPPPATNPFDPRDPEKRSMGPMKIGAVDSTAWGKQTAEQTADAITKLKAFGEEARKALGVNLTPYETNFFLVYTDLGQTEAMKWVSVLDRMYGRLSVLFAVPVNENIWHGKALIFIFAREEDYLKFEVKMHKTVAAGTAGLCHSYGSGDVHIAFYRQPNDMDFAHVLVHESIHGFLHRYRSPVDIPSWANEGLAEAIATDMVPRKGIAQSALGQARSDLQSRKSLENFFAAGQIVAWQYPVARSLCEFMIQQNKKGYVEFIDGIKDGMDWKEALATKYGVSVDQLINAYGNSMGVAGLKP